MKTQVLEKLREAEGKWLILNDELNREPGLVARHVKDSPGDMNSSLSGLISSTKEKITEQLRIIAWLPEILSLENDALIPENALDDANYLSQQAISLLDRLEKTPWDAISDVLDDITLRVLSLGIPMWSKNWETRFSRIISQIERN